MRYQQRVRDDHARGAGVRPEDADGFARLDDQRFVAVERAQRRDDGVEGFPAARGTAGAAVDDEIVGPLGHFRIEIVHQHPERGFLRPPLALEGGAAPRANDPGTGSHCGEQDRGEKG